MKKRLRITLLGCFFFGQTFCAVELIGEKKLQEFKMRVVQLKNVSLFGRAKSAMKFGLGASACVTLPTTLLIVPWIQSDDTRVKFYSECTGFSEDRIREKISLSAVSSDYVENVCIFGMLHFLYKMAKREIIVRRLQTVLSRSAQLDFKALDLYEAMMVVAAYDQNVLMLQYLAQKTDQFLNQDGVWQALADLFTKSQASADMVARLKKAVLV